MNLVVKGFSNDVDLEDLSRSTFFLVLDNDGKVERLPVPQETISHLMALAYGKKPEVPARPQEVEAAPPSPAMRVDDPFVGEEAEAEEFGGAFAEDADPEPDMQAIASGDEDDVPDTEDKIPSL